MAQRVVETWFGVVVLSAEAGAVTGLRWRGAQERPDGRPRGREPGPDSGADSGAVSAPESGMTHALLDEAAAQLCAYAEGRLRGFDLPLRVVGSDFQRRVCDAMRAIPYGETRSYGELARDLAVSAQALGRACGGNPIPVIIPCHRVLGAGGALVGYSGRGGVETKLALLRHEGAGGYLI